MVRHGGLIVGRSDTAKRCELVCIEASQCQLVIDMSGFQVAIR